MSFNYYKKNSICSFFIKPAAIIIVGISFAAHQPAKSLAIAPQSKQQSKQLPEIGEFQLKYTPTSSHQRVQQYIQASTMFETVVEKLNQKQLNLPVDIPIIFKDCGTPNAFYDPNKHEVSLCYELFELSDEVFNNDSNSSVSNGVFILLHEVGHALVDSLDLAFTGKEEDSVDDFAATFLLDDKNELPESTILVGSQFFSALPDSEYWDEHSFGQQRQYNLICLLFGKDPQKYLEVATNSGLGVSRAQRCHSEYQDKVSSWQRILAPHSIYDANVPPKNSGDGALY